MVDFKGNRRVRGFVQQLLPPLNFEAGLQPLNCGASQPPLATECTRPTRAIRDSPLLRTLTQGDFSEAAIESGRAILPRELRQSSDSLGDSLQFALAENLTSKIARIEEVLDYLAEGNPFGYSRQQCLDDYQRSEDMFSDIPHDIEEGTEEYGHFINARSAEMDARWKPRFSSVPTQSWQRRILRIQSANRHSALIGYEQLGGEIEYLLSAVESSAGALDDYVEQRIEEMRGN